MLSPKIWSGTPYGNRTAFVDLTGTVELFFRAAADTIFDLTGATITVLPIGSGGGSGQWLLAVQQMFVSACVALGIAPPADLASYNLSDEGDFTSWCFTLSQEGERIRVAAGIP